MYRGKLYAGGVCDASGVGATSLNLTMQVFGYDLTTNTWDSGLFAGAGASLDYDNVADNRDRQCAYDNGTGTTNDYGCHWYPWVDTWTGVELYPPSSNNFVYRPMPMLEAHDLAVFGPGGDLELGRQGVALDRQRVVARRRERVRQALEQALAGMMDRAGLAVHEGLGADDVAAEGLAHGLVPEADAQDRQILGGAAQQGQADPRLIRRARTGRKQDRLGLHGEGVLDGDGVVAAHDGLGPKLGQVVDEVVGKAVVVIDDQDHASLLGGLGLCAKRARPR